MYIYNLGQLFNKVALENRSRTALRSGTGNDCTYKELDELSDRIAYFLLKQGLKINDVAALFNNKSKFSYAIMLACLKLGVIYVNIDPASPDERLNRMIIQCKPTVFFYYSGSFDKRNLELLNNIIYVNYSDIRFSEVVMKQPAGLPTQNYNVTGNTPAYIMFTSGSTGFPKGVVISHSNVINFIVWSKSIFSTTEDDIFTNVNPMHFDNSVFDFYSSLFTGASLIPVNEMLTRNPRKMFDVLNGLNPTIWFSVPSMLVYILRMRALKENDLLSLRTVSFGGEGFPKNQLRNLWKYWGHRVKFINVYGPTECTCICSSYVVSEYDLQNDELLPIGPLAPNFFSLVIDENGNPVDNGIQGELCIGGPNVGMGYYNDSSRTAEVFIQNPLVSSHWEIVYKSGDLVSYDEKKNVLHFMGRKDNQVKRMGYRIELEEIEHALNAFDYVRENSVIFLDNDRIIACISSEIRDENQYLRDLQRFLPSYMMPDSFRFYEDLPKNQNGKIDRLKLKQDLLQ